MSASNTGAELEEDWIEKDSDASLDDEELEEGLDDSDAELEDADDSDDSDDGDGSDDPEESAETLDKLEEEELEMLTEDEAAEALPVDEAEELRQIRRAAIALESGAEDQQEDEFVCAGCFLVKRTSQLANRRKKLCKDCV